MPVLADKVVLTAEATSVVITPIGLAFPYQVAGSPSWNTAWWVTDTTSTSFRLNFEVPAPVDGEFGYVVGVNIAGDLVAVIGSEPDFLNDALGQVGATRITSMLDGSVNANWCKVFWPRLRQALLRMHHWNFATARATLVQNATVPVFGFAYAYDLPTGFLKITEYNGILIDPSNQIWGIYTYPGIYRIESGKLLSNDGEAKIQYLYDVVYPALFDPLFYQMASAWLASKLASAINKDSARSTKLLQEAIGILLPLGAAVDGQEGTVVPYIQDDLLYGR